MLQTFLKIIRPVFFMPTVCWLSTACAVVYSKCMKPFVSSLNIIGGQQSNINGMIITGFEKNTLNIEYIKSRTKFASNANLHKFANFHSFVTISETVKMLVGGIPPNP